MLTSLLSHPRRLSFIFLFGSALLVGGCGKSEPMRGQSDPGVTRSSPIQSGATSVAENSEPLEQRRAAFLNRIRAADPQKATIERAIINDKNELGLILSRQTNLDDVPKLLKSMLVQMNQVFPNQDLNAIAYTPTIPPHTIGTAHLDIRTRDMTYQPVATSPQPKS